MNRRALVCLLVSLVFVAALDPAAFGWGRWRHHQPSQARTHFHEQWAHLPANRRHIITENQRRFAQMTADQQRLIRNRWQFFRHLPPGRQQELLKEYEAWKKLTPAQRLAMRRSRPGSRARTAPL